MDFSIFRIRLKYNFSIWYVQLSHDYQTNSQSCEAPPATAVPQSYGCRITLTGAVLAYRIFSRKFIQSTSLEPECY